MRLSISVTRTINEGTLNSQNLNEMIAIKRSIFRTGVTFLLSLEVRQQEVLIRPKDRHQQFSIKNKEELTL